MAAWLISVLCSREVFVFYISAGVSVGYLSQPVSRPGINGFRARKHLPFWSALLERLKTKVIANILSALLCWPA